MSQLAFSFRRTPKKPFSFRKFLRKVKAYGFEIIPLIITVLLLIEFSIKEITPIIHSILHLLGFL